MSEYESMMRANNDFKSEQDRQALEENICLIGIFAIKDPIRASVPNSVKMCHKAGINVRMVTGDNIDTAKAIAREAGILTDADMKKEYACMTGEQFAEEIGGLKQIENEKGYTKEEVGNKQAFRKIQKDLKVMARSSP